MDEIRVVCCVAIINRFIFIKAFLFVYITTQNDYLFILFLIYLFCLYVAWTEGKVNNSLETFLFRIFNKKNFKIKFPNNANTHTHAHTNNTHTHTQVREEMGRDRDTHKHTRISSIL